MSNARNILGLVLCVTKKMLRKKKIANNAELISQILLIDQSIICNAAIAVKKLVSKRASDAIHVEI